MSSTETITLEKFKDISVRKVEQNGITMIPVVDIANAVNIDRSNLSKLMTRNDKFFSEYKGVVKIATPGGDQMLVCLTRDGVMGLLFKVDAMRSKDEEMQDRIIDFQHWATKILGQTSLKAPVSKLQKGEKVKEILNQHLDLADIAVERSGVPKGIAHSMAWILAGEAVGTDLQPYASYIKAQTATEKLLLPETTGTRPDDQADFDSYFTVSQIAGFLQLTRKATQNLLESKNIICFKDGRFHLTTFGKPFGKEFPVILGYPYADIKKVWIRYTPKLLEYLRKEGMAISTVKVAER